MSIEKGWEAIRRMQAVSDEEVASMATDTKAVARWDIGTDGLSDEVKALWHYKGRYVLFTDHEQVVAELTKAHQDNLDSWLHQREEIAFLRAELAAKSKDAERYRWLRDVAHPDSEATSLHVSYERVNDWGNWYSEHVTGRFLDGSIDNAIKAMGDGHDTDA